MAEIGTRPGGLTALAVINFVFCFFGLLSAGGTLLTPLFMSKGLEAMEQQERAETRAAAARAEGVESAPGSKPADASAAARRREEREEARAVMEKMREVPFATIALAAGMEAVIAILLLVSGIGYLKLRRGLGRTLGTVYAVVAAAWAAMGAAYMQKLTGQSFGLLNMIGFIYPLLTIFLLRVTFKDDFVNA